MSEEPFYWRHARDSLLTPTAVKLFQLICAHDGEEFDKVKDQIDSDYALVTGSASSRHGGKVQTAKEVYREAGWLELEKDNGKELIRITPAGKQADLLLGKVPDFLKAVPFFVVELLSRYQLNNPAKPPSRDPAYNKQLSESNVFPYWTLFKILRSVGNYINAEELRRFVFLLKKSEDIPTAISNIKNFRIDLSRGMTSDKLDEKYGSPLEGAVAEPKYLMGRLGTQVGMAPPLIKKSGASRYELEPSYIPFVDDILKNEPIFGDYLDEKTWMNVYGQPVNLEAGNEVQFDDDESQEPFPQIADDDQVWLLVNSLLSANSLNIIFTGPPGTSKTWYASRIASKIVNGDKGRVRIVQFHPSFSYDDFVEGYIPMASPAEGGGGLFEIVPKIFLKLCDLANKSKEKFVLVIDEVTRGDCSRILGELLTYIEPDYRNKFFTLAYSGRRVRIPENLIILGTMNPYDKSVSELDDALERRFERISLNPSVNILTSILKEASMSGELIGKVVEFFNSANKLMPHGFGHAFFLRAKDESDLTRLWNHKLKFVFDKVFRFDPSKIEQIKLDYSKLVSDPSVLM